MAKTAATKEWAYVAHPAAGLRYSGKREPHRPLPSKLGMRWLRLSREEQARRRRAFFAALLEPWLEPGSATFEASGLKPDACAALAPLDDVAVGDGEAAGDLSREALDVLLRAAPARVAVTSGERTLLDARDRWRRVLVLLDDDEAHGVEERTRALDERLRARAARGPDRRRRATALLATYWLLLVAALGVAVGALTLLDSVLSPVVAIPAAMAAGLVFFSSLEPVLERALRWYGEG